MAILGGSPLGLIGLLSGPKYGGMSGFNGGNSRNVNVTAYNMSQAGSLFSGKRRLRAWPNLEGTKSVSFKVDKDNNPTSEEDSTEIPDTLGLATVYVDKNGTGVDGYVPLRGTSGAAGSNRLHNNDVYDTSVLNLVEKLAGTRAALRPSDFAYLKDLGVYPNNRLMVARRFLGAIGDNIMTKTKDKFPATATLISWRPEGDDFLEIQFGEEWEAAKADFTGLLNQIGDDFMAGSVGSKLAGAGNIMPLPGFTEIFQRHFLSKLGLLDKGAGNQIPAGNPNLIKEAKRRKTVGYGEAGSGLMCKVSIKMVCEYELKFISGIDPTIVWMDLLGTIVRFGTSESSNYGLSGGVAARLAKWSANPRSLMTDIANSIRDAITKARTELEDAVKEVYKKAKEAAEQLDDGSSSGDGTDGTGAKKKEKSDKEKALEMAEAAKKAGFNIINKLIAFAGGAIKGTILKYRVEMMGIVNALTGAPSTPWHITIGNPLRPVFCSGDMLTSEVTLKLGSTLAFNDLPSSITVEFTLTNARNWGLQEIMAKFNSGYLRTVDVQRSYFETSAKEVKTKDAKGKEGKDIQEEEVGSMLLTMTFSTTSYGDTGGPSPGGPSPSSQPASKVLTPEELEKQKNAANSGIDNPIQTKQEGGDKPSLVGDNSGGKQVVLNNGNNNNANTLTGNFSSVP